MKLIGLPDELIYEVFKYTLAKTPETITPGEGTFNYNSNVRFILSTRKFRNLINLSLACRELRMLVITFLGSFYQDPLFLSLARVSEVPNLIEFRKLKGKLQLIASPFCNYSLSLHVTHLELCLNFIKDQGEWSNIVSTFSKITSLKILGNSDHYWRVFKYSTNKARFTNLTHASIPLPFNSMAMQALGKAIKWSQLKQLSLFVDPFGNFTINIITEVMDMLRYLFKSNCLQKLNLLGGNNVIYTDAVMMLAFGQFLKQLSHLKSLTIMHRTMRSPSFSTYSDHYDTSYDYQQSYDSFVLFFKAIRDLKSLDTLVLDMEALRIFDQGFSRVFYEIEPFGNDNLELVLCEKSFLYPISNEHLEEILRCILTVQCTSVSLKLGVQIEIPVENYLILLLQRLSNALTTRFNYARVRSIDYELCWSIMEDSYVLEYNDKQENKLLRWERPPMASSLYKQMEQQEIKYTNVYDEDADYRESMRSGLVKYPLCSYNMAKAGNDEVRRLRFWQSKCELDDHLEFNNLGNRKGGIFD